MIDLSKLVSFASPEGKRVFGAYAGRKKERWRELIGQRITHELLGEGEIVDLQHSPVLHEDCFYIKFAHETRHFKVRQFTNDPHVLTLTLSEQTVTNIRQIVKQIRTKRLEREQREQERLETLRIEAEQQELRRQQQLREEAQRRQEQEEQRQREAQDEKNFEFLKSKYGAGVHQDSSPSSPLYIILLQIDGKEPIDKAQIDWLKKHHLYEPLAHHYQNAYRRSRDPWLLVQASSFWRDAEQPDRVIKLTDFLLDRTYAVAAKRRGGCVRYARIASRIRAVFAAYQLMPVINRCTSKRTNARTASKM